MEEKSIFFTPVDVPEVEDKIQALKSDLSKGLDGTTSKAMKPIADVVAPKLCELYNVHLQNGTFEGDQNDSNL